MTIFASTIEGNEATDSGGGIFNEGSITLENVTLAGNRAGVGAALSQSTGDSTLRHVTVSLNVADTAAVHRNGGTMSMFNSIVAGNSDGEVSGAMTISHSLLRDSVRWVLDPGGLKDNGGPTKTIRLVGGSNPALNLGAHATCSDVGFVDQRGFRGRAAPPPPVMPAPCSATVMRRRRSATWVWRCVTACRVPNSEPGAGLGVRRRDWHGIQRFSLQRQRDGGSWTALTTSIQPCPTSAPPRQALQP